jgi:alpha-L-fucosidase
MKCLIQFWWIWSFGVTALLAAGPTPDPYAGETPSQRDARMKWWREARFGMFIHWGVYSVPAGTYHDQQIGGIGEWIMNSAKIPASEYQGFARQFNPTKYNPDEWVKLAKAAGMKYIIITSKHHDGFALFDSKVTTWDAVDATPYGKDLLKPLADACRRHGLKLGFYYSQAQDWCHAGGAAAGGHWDKAQDGSMDDYLRDIAVPQVREILTHYGPIAVLWWDTPFDMTQERADLLIPLLSLQPGIIHNNRLGAYRGDTETPEQFVPATGYPGRDWETCMTMNDTWGYKSYDQHWKSAEDLIRNLVDIASKGGNYLLNVGPSSEGLIPEPSVERLKAVGAWMKVNGKAIYATSASPFRRLPWGRCTQKPLNNGDTVLYLHVFDWPANGKLMVAGLKNRVRSAALLASGKRLSVAGTPAGPEIEVPTPAPDAISTTVVLTIQGKPDVEPYQLKPAADGSLWLPAAEATIHGSQLQYESGNGKDNLGYWTNPQDWAEWQFQLPKPGPFKVTAEIAAMGNGAFEIQAGAQKLAVHFQNTGDYTKFVVIDVGTLDLASSGKTILQVKPVSQGWQPVNLKCIRLNP